jgi:hypothetical protein
MIEATQRKIREARFFYQRLVDERQRRVVNEPEAFRFYFSAFLSAATSVPEALSHEGKKKYRAWAPEWDKQLTPEERKLEQFAYRLRVAEVHLSGTDLIVEREEIAVHELLNENVDRDVWRTLYAQRGSGPLGRETGTTFRPDYYLEDEAGKAQAIAICKQHLDYLEKLVTDFLKAHDKR